MTRPLDELAGALAAFQSEVPVVPKKQTAQVKSERTGASYSYTYADLATIAPVVMPLLAKHGLAFTTLPTAPEGRAPMLVGMLVHTSGQFVRGELPISGRTPQEIGSSLTYARRYLLGCLTGVVTDDDDDGALATTAAKKRARKAPERPPEDDAPPPPPVAPVTPIQRKPRTAGGTPQAPPAAPEPNPSPAMHETQRRALFAAIGEAFPDAGRDERLALCSAVIGRRIGSSDELDAREGSAILSWVDDFRAGREAYQYEPETGLAYVWPMDPEPAP